MRSRRTAQPPPGRTNRSQSLKPHIDDDRALTMARQPPSRAKSMNPINADSGIPTECDRRANRSGAGCRGSVLPQMRVAFVELPDLAVRAADADDRLADLGRCKTPQPMRKAIRWRGFGSHDEAKTRLFLFSSRVAGIWPLRDRFRRTASAAARAVSQIRGDHRR